MREVGDGSAIRPSIQAHLCHQQLGDHGRVLFPFAPPVSHLSRKITITGAVPRIKWRDGCTKCWRGPGAKQHQNLLGAWWKCKIWGRVPELLDLNLHVSKIPSAFCA